MVTLPTFALVGAGNRGGDVYGDYLLRHPDRGRLVALAERDAGRRELVADRHALATDMRFESAEALLERPRIADVLIVATPDAHHAGAAVAGIERGYHVLLEKPMAPDAAGVTRIEAAARRHGASVSVAHVLRYTPFFRAIKRLLDAGAVGRLIDVAHVEHVGYWHFAHSYVRGNWRREDDASPMILAKACHDLDVLRWLIGAPCTKLASFGSLTHFVAAEAPEGAAARCLDCSVERSCPYSARRIYLERFASTDGWPITVLTDDPTIEGRLRALRTGPYGRCVYACDNDVADHQVVAMSFANGVSATLGVHAFSEANARSITLSGTHGELRGRLDESRIEWRDFVTGRCEIVDVLAKVTALIGADDGVDRHEGGDDGLMRDLTDRLAITLAGGGPPTLASSWEASLESHAMAFAAERARRHDLVVYLSEPDGHEI
ncbi:MAG: Gfo/Idh/MocA family oxidoreductase [Trueperaceae bacterium]|nr:Gfo/Idh/MocA family oxidoreductase [Trueperaceae bacterium]